MPLIISDELYHTGRPHEGMIPHSGRYPYGSGEDAYQKSIHDFVSMLNAYKRDYPEATDAEIAKAFGMKRTEYNARKANAKEYEKMTEYARVKRMRDKDQMSFQAIADELGLKGESSARNIYNKNEEVMDSVAKATADLLKDRIDSTQGYLDIGKGVDVGLGISRERMDRAVVLLKDQGYVELGYSQEQATNPGKVTIMKVLCPPGTVYKDVYDHKERLVNVEDYHGEDGGAKFFTFEYPASMDSKRLKIRYAEEGGKEQDGVIELRRGVPDLSLGDARYSQVRILVDGKSYLKGMARYSDDMPDGIDVIFNTNKAKGTPMDKVLKDIKKDDPNNPFGSLIKADGQSHYVDPKDGKTKLSLINKRADEGDWGEWSKELPSQFLGKQDLKLINRQLNLSIANKQSELDEIMSITNPTIKKAMLKSFADDCDTTAVHLQAASLPRQRYQVILPVPSLKDNEVYAPNYRDGETVALIRYPHGGTFEIPIVTVNNKHAESKKIIGAAKDAVGINSKVAERLSGADFDGDTVMVIPCNRTQSGRVSNVQITSRGQLEGLKDFDPHMQYAERPGMKYMSKKYTQKQMGEISNLITDMTLIGAHDDELAKAVRHSMVVIDAAKHKLDYKQSEIDNDIKALKRKYQLHETENGNESTGAATILSRAKGQKSVPKRVGAEHIDPETGKKIYREEDETWTTTSKTGKVTVHHKTQRSTQMAETDDAFTLVRDPHNLKEVAYANFANKMKAFANDARKEMVATKGSEYNPKANAMYQEEVKAIKNKVAEAKKNHPRERKAQTIADIKMKAILDDNPSAKEDKEQWGKIKQRTLAEARKAVGSVRPHFDVTDREWEAIQAGGVSSTLLSELINYVGVDKLASRATPRNSSNALPTKDINRIQNLYNSGSYTVADIADAVGCSTSTVWKYISG